MEKYPFSEEKYERWIKEGRGTGEAENYLSWLTYNDVEGKNKHRLKEGRSGRVCALFDDEQHRVFLQLDASASVSAIYEHWPADRDATRRIAEHIGVAHPRDKDKGIDLVLTTSFLVKLVPSKSDAARKVALTCMQEKDLADFRRSEIAEILRQYWSADKTPWYLVTGSCVPEHLFENLQLLYARRFLHQEPPGRGIGYEERTEILLRHVRDCAKPMSLYQLSLELSAHYGGANHKWLEHAHHLVYRHALLTDLYRKDLNSHCVLDIARRTWPPHADRVREAA